MNARSVIGVLGGVLLAWVVVAAPVSNQAGGQPAAPSGIGPAATPLPPARPGANSPGARTLPGAAPMSAPETVPPALRTPAVDDAPTTRPVPVDMPAIKDLHALMEKMKTAHKKSGDKNPEVARKAAREVGALSLAALHPRLAENDPRWTPLAEDLVARNLAVQRALAPGAGDRAALMAALKGQNESCNACHRVFRVED